jgi:hypothetical protein
VCLSRQKVLIPPVPCQASFVIKTQLQTPHLVTGTPPLTKVFINATYADEVPEQQDAEKLRGIVNCVVSDVRETADKGELPSVVGGKSLPLTSRTCSWKAITRHRCHISTIANTTMQERQVVQAVVDTSHP